MTSTVGPSQRQGIIDMLSGGTVGQFCEPDPRQKDESGKLPTGA